MQGALVLKNVKDTLKKIRDNTYEADGRGRIGETLSVRELASLTYIRSF